MNCRENLRQGPFSRLAAMRRLTVLALAAAATLAFAACGGGEDAKLLPGTTAAEITANLETVEQLAGEGECVGAANAAQDVSTQVETVEGIDPKLKQALQRGAEKLNEVVTTCQESEETETVSPASEATTEETTKLPPGQEKKAEKDQEKEEQKAEKELEKAEKHEPEPPAEEAPEEKPPTTPPPTDGGGTGAPGGVSPGTPAEPGGGE
jgi:outer membrane biosynthesis protein TonB